jgi:hypothetical protein
MCCQVCACVCVRVCVCDVCVCVSACARGGLPIGWPRKRWRASTKQQQALQHSPSAGGRMSSFHFCGQGTMQLVACLPRVKRTCGGHTHVRSATRARCVTVSRGGAKGEPARVRARQAMCASILPASTPSECPTAAHPLALCCVFKLEVGAHGLLALGVHQHDVGVVDGRLVQQGARGARRGGWGGRKARRRGVAAAATSVECGGERRHTRHAPPCAQ